MSGRPDIIAVNLTPAMSGYFATLYRWTEEHGGYYEPWETGLGRYPTWEGANAEGARWAADLGVAFQPATAEAAAEAEVRLAASRKLFARVRELRSEGLSLRDAVEAAKAGR
jgi:hypothetical protein